MAKERDRMSELTKTKLGEKRKREAQHAGTEETSEGDSLDEMREILE
jgi:hypothetical protein